MQLRSVLLALQLEALRPFRLSLLQSQLHPLQYLHHLCQYRLRLHSQSTPRNQAPLCHRPTPGAFTVRLLLHMIRQQLMHSGQIGARQKPTTTRKCMIQTMVRLRQLHLNLPIQTPLTALLPHNRTILRLMLLLSGSVSMIQKSAPRVRQL